MKTLVQGRAIVDLLSNPREITNGNRVHPCFPAPTHEIRRHDVKQVVQLPGFLSIRLMRGLSTFGDLTLDRTFCQYRQIDLMSRPLYITAVIAWVSPKSTATLRCPWGFFASIYTTRWARSRWIGIS
jgi:hypothetical protein